MPWSDITKKKEFQDLPPEEQVALKVRYFTKRVLPDIQKKGVPAEDQGPLFRQWMEKPDDSGQGYATSLLSSAARGATSFIPGAIGGVGEIVGSDTLVGAADSTEAAINRALPINPIYNDDWGIKGANVVGQVGSTIGLGGVGGVTGKLLAGTRGIRAGAETAALGSGFLSGTREGGQQARQYDMEGAPAYLRALLGGATELASEKLLFGLGTETAAARRLLGETLDKGVGGFGKAVGTEAGEEVAAQVGGNLATTGLAPEGVQTPGMFEGAGEAAILGGLGGGVFGTVNALTQPTIESGEIPIPPELRSDRPWPTVELAGVGTVAYDPRKVTADQLRGLSTAEIESGAQAGALRVTPPAQPADPVQEAAANVQAAADVAPQTAAALQEALSDETPPTLDTDLPTVQTAATVELPTEPVGPETRTAPEIEPVVAGEGQNPSPLTGATTDLTDETSIRGTDQNRAVDPSTGLPAGLDTAQEPAISGDQVQAFSSYLRTVTPTDRWSDTDYAAAQQFADTGDFELIRALPKAKRNAVVRELLAFSPEARARQEAADRRGEDKIKKQEKSDRRLEEKTNFKRLVPEGIEDLPDDIASASIGGRGVPKYADTAYMAAVEAGDMEATQRMVNQAARETIGRSPRSVVELGRFLSKGEFESARARVKPLPRKVFYVGNVEVIRNPTGDDIRGMTAEARSARGGRPSVDPDTRFTHDNYGNTWRWKSEKGTHSMIEPSIKREEGVEVNQNNGLPYHTDLVKDAIRNGEYIPNEVLAEYPRYAEFLKPSSSDPITRDDTGNVIPLSQRFNPASNDIRESRAEGEPTSPQSIEDYQKILTDRLGLTNFSNIVFGNYGLLPNGVRLKGFVRANSNKVYLNLGAINNADELADTFNEEATHLIYSDPAVAAEWARLKELVPQDQLDALRAEMEARGYAESVWDEEAYNDIARKLGYEWLKQPEWKKLWNAIRSAVRRIFGLTDDKEINRVSAAIVSYAIEHQQSITDDVVAEGESRSSPFRESRAAPTEMTGEPEPGKRFSQFGERTMVDERLTEELRDQPPTQFEIRGQQAAHNQAADFIRVQGRDAALSAFQNEDSGIRPEVRIAGLMQLAQQFDALAAFERAKGNDAGSDAFDSLLERAVEAKAALESIGNETGRNLAMYNTWARLSPDGVLRRFERMLEKELRTKVEGDLGTKYDDVLKELQRLRQDFAKATGLTKSELRQAWELFDQAAMNVDARKAVYDVLKGLRPRKVSPSSDTIQRMFATPDTIRGQMNKEGETLVRNFFQMMAGPRPQAGPLTEFDTSIQQALGQMLRKVMTEQGLVNDGESLQMKDIDRLVRAVSADPLRFDKIAAADAKMQEELDAIEDEAQRETLRQAWEEATAQMVTNIGGEPTIRRVLNQELKGTAWNAAFDTGKPRAEAVQSIKDKAVGAVMAKVKGKLTDADKTVANNVAMLQQEVEEAFDRIRDVKFAQWLEGRERAATADRAKKAKAAFMEALKAKGVAERALNSLAKALSDTPQDGSKPKVHPVQALIGEHIKAPVDDFVLRMNELGIPTADAEQLDKVIELNRSRAEVAAREKALQQAIEALKPKTKEARTKVDKLTRAVLNGAEEGVLNRTELARALAEAFDVPVMTAQQRQEFSDLVADINQLPEGALREWKATELYNRLAMFRGIAAQDALLAMWYANILSGLSTQGVNLWGNGLILAMRTVATMLGSGSLSDSTAMFKGMTFDGVKRGVQEMRNTWRDGIQHKTLKMDDQQKAGTLALLRNIPFSQQSAGQKVAYILSLGTLTDFVFRAMGAVDALFWHTAQEGRAYIAVNRTLRQQGMKPGTPEFNAEFIKQLGGDDAQFKQDMEQARKELLEAGQPAAPHLVMRRAWELRLNRRSDDVREQSTLFADRLVSQQKPEGIGNAVTQVISKIQQTKPFGLPIFVPLLPFNKIVSNLLEGGLDFAGVGIIRGLVGHHLTAGKDGRQFDDLERRERFMSGVMGLTVAGVAWAIAQGFKDEPDEETPFMIYGFGPKDKNKREQMPKGWRPFTMKVGDTYVNYAETPMGMMLAAVGSWLDSERYEKGRDKKSAGDRALYSMMAAIRGFSSQGVLSSIGTTMDVLTGQENPNKLKRMPGQTLSGGIPLQGLLRDVSTLFDDTKIDDNSLYAAMVKDIPVLKSEGTRPSLNIFGEPVKIEGMPVIRRFVVNQRPDPVSDFIGRNQLTVPGLPQTIEIGDYLGKVKEPLQKRIMQMMALENLVMTPDQRYQFVKRSGELTKKAVEHLRTTTKGKIDAARIDHYQRELNKRVAAAREQAMRELVRDLK